VFPLLNEAFVEVDTALALGTEEVTKSHCSWMPSSHLRLRRVAVELVESFRVRLLGRITPRSSTMPDVPKQDCSSG